MSGQRLHGSRIPPFAGETGMTEGGVCITSVNMPHTPKMPVCNIEKSLLTLFPDVQSEAVENVEENVKWKQRVGGARDKVWCESWEWFIKFIRWVFPNGGSQTRT